MKAHLVGGGLASLAAATYLLKAGTLAGEDVTIYEAAPRPGGSLGLAGSPEEGFVYPGGRVFERQYRCALEFVDQIPSGVHPDRSVKDDIDFFNEHHPWKNRCRLIDSKGVVIDASRLRLSIRHQVEILRTILTPERFLDGKCIADLVAPSFFRTNFWYIWSSIMAFRPEHSAMEFRRYLLRFFHLLPQLASMEYILRTRFHQYQSIVEPTVAWLEGQGVQILTGAVVEEIELAPDTDTVTATAIRYGKNGHAQSVPLSADDIVLVTNGSQLAGASLGSMEAAPAESVGESTAWSLWQALAQRRPGLGNPSTFTDHTAHSTWVSFTVTTRSERFMQLLEGLTQREAGRGGLVTFRDSRWLLTFTRFHDPNLRNFDPGAHILWGYGIYPERNGDFVEKPMTRCTGREILTELVRHLHMAEHLDEVLEASNCRPCLLPYASSVCLQRKLGDRPKVVPDGATNLGFIGQFSEQPQDVVFTMEYSVRSARAAVHSLLKTGRPPPPVFKGYLHPKIAFGVARSLLR